MHSIVVRKSRKHFGCVTDSSFKDSALTAVKRVEKFLTRYVKGVLFVNRR